MTYCLKATKLGRVHVLREWFTLSDSQVKLLVFVQMSPIQYLKILLIHNYCLKFDTEDTH